MNLMAAVIGLLMQVGGVSFPGPGGFAAAPSVTLSYTANASTNSSGASVTTNNVTVATGDVIEVICAVWTANFSFAPTMADTLGNTWTQIGDTGRNDHTNHNQSWAWTTVSSSSGTDAFTCNPHDSTGDHLDIAALGYTGATATDSGATDFNNNDSVSTGVTHSVTTTAIDTLITYSFGPGSSSIAFNVPSGFTTRFTGAGTSGSTLKVYDKSAVAAGAQTVLNNASSGSTPIHSGLIGIHP